MTDSRWEVTTDDDAAYTGFISTFDEANYGLATISANRSGTNVIHPGEAIELFDFMAELVHEIERLQGENIDMASELKYLRFASSLPYRAPYPHDDFSMGST